MGNSIASNINRPSTPQDEDRTNTAQQAQNQGAQSLEPNFSPGGGFDLDAHIAGLREPNRPQTYVVQPGDSLSEISEQFYGDSFLFTEIAAENGITDPNFGIKAGQVLKIPGLGAVTDEYRQSLNRTGRNEISRLGNEALNSIANFDYNRLYEGDFLRFDRDLTVNDSAVRELVGLHRRAGLDANLNFAHDRFTEGSYDISRFTASVNGREVFRNESGIFTGGRPIGSGESDSDVIARALEIVKDNAGEVGTVIGNALGGARAVPQISGRLLTQSKTVGDLIAGGPRGHLNAFQRGVLANADTLDDAVKVFSSASNSGKAIRGFANSPVLKVAKKLPVVGNTIGALTIPAAGLLAEPGNEARDTFAASVSFGGGVAVPLLVGAGLAFAGAPIAIGASLVAAGVYTFGGGAQGLEGISKEIYDDYLREVFEGQQ